MPDQFNTKPDFSKQAEIEERLTAELQAARLTYEFSTEYYKRAVKGSEKLDMDHPNGEHYFQATDGILSVTQATNSQRGAFENYLRALEAFDEFVMRGEVPKPD
jgi:hypothetical protein